MDDLTLNIAEAAILAALLEPTLRERTRRNCGSLGPQVTAVLARLSHVLPDDVAAQLPALSLAAASASQYRSSPLLRSKFALPATGPRPSMEELTAPHAARTAGCTIRAIQLACAERRLPGRKGPAGGWLIRRADLADWMHSRAA